MLQVNESSANANDRHLSVPCDRYAVIVAGPNDP
jgi:hypothetical protein